ncbi:EbsA family protein [Carnobacterium sp. TMP28]|uniref:EbsA family protein n=1 Tax=Carnobacterium sp. TMP28 TaxID=3397060 RepID=UPI0039DF4BDB
MNKVKASKVRLSLDPAFQLIYWSICWLMLFLSVILFLEKQRFIFSFIGVVFWVLFLYFGMGSTLKVTKNTLFIHYFRGVKKKNYPLSAVNQLVLSNHRLVKLEIKPLAEPLVLYLNKKNKKIVVHLLQEWIPTLEVKNTLSVEENEQRSKE